VTGLDDRTARALEEQQRYYDLRAPDYVSGAPSDRGDGAPDFGYPAADRAALVDQLQPAGDVLELACGPGHFTRELARHARTLTAVDASPAMLERAAAEVVAPNVRFERADLFAGWRPGRTFDLVFFGFFLSHVPPTAFDGFWSLVRDCVGPRGRVGFVDEDDRAADRDEVRLADGVPVARRRLRDGREHDIVKVFWNAADLAGRLTTLGWDVDVRAVGDGALFGEGRPADQ
jgi:demethylmenaquinone methyltransferase/2-methoxy-6-polyprenyl-1,4-benzoquinol methylase